MTTHTYDSGLIGNCSYIAHIQKNTNISWLCLPRFDSDFVFGGMLDQERGGEFTILPESGDFQSTQRYLENTECVEKTQWSIGVALPGAFGVKAKADSHESRSCHRGRLFSEWLRKISD